MSEELDELDQMEINKYVEVVLGSEDESTSESESESGTETEENGVAGDGDGKQESPPPPPKAPILVVDLESDADIEIEEIYFVPPALDPNDSGLDERDEASSGSDADHFCSPESTESESEEYKDGLVKHEQNQQEKVVVKIKGQGQSWLLSDEDDVSPIEDMDILTSETESERNESVEEKYASSNQDLGQKSYPPHQVNGGEQVRCQVEVNSEDVVDDDDSDLDFVTSCSDDEFEEVMEDDDHVKVIMGNQKVSTSESESKTENEVNGIEGEESPRATFLQKVLNEIRSFQWDDSDSNGQSIHVDGDHDENQQNSSPKHTYVVVFKSDSEAEIEESSSASHAPDPNNSGSEEISAVARRILSPAYISTRGRGRGGRLRRRSDSHAAETPKRTLRKRIVPPKK